MSRKCIKVVPWNVHSHTFYLFNTICTSIHELNFISQCTKAQGVVYYVPFLLSSRYPQLPICPHQWRLHSVILTESPLDLIAIAIFDYTWEVKSVISALLWRIFFFSISHHILLYVLAWHCRQSWCYSSQQNPIIYSHMCTTVFKSSIGRHAFWWSSMPLKTTPAFVSLPANK